MVRLLCFFILSFQAFALKGVVLFFEVPMFSRPDETSKVIQWLKKGDKVSLHPIHRQVKEGEVDYVEKVNIYENNELIDVRDFLLNEERKVQYYKTIDRNGRMAYILKRHVKPIFEDSSELSQPIEEYPREETDYRLLEPLKDSYPFKEEVKRRVQVTTSVGLPAKDSYRFGGTPLSQDYGLSYGFQVAALKNINFEESNRFYMGARLSYLSSQTTTEFERVNASQTYTRLALAPMVSFDFFRAKKRRLNLQLGVDINIIDSHEVEVFDQSITFSTYSLHPFLSFLYQKRDVFENFDLNLGPQVQLIPSATLEGSASDLTSDAWANRTQHSRDQRSDLSFIIGLHRNI